MLSKRSQIGIFLILGIVILVVVVMLFQIKKAGVSDNLDDQKNIPVNMAKDVQPIYNSIEVCLKESTDDAIVTLGQNGGYAVLPEKSFNNASFFELPYFYFKGEDHSPSLEDMEKSLSVLIGENIDYCMEDVFLSYDYVTYKDDGKKIDVSILNDSLIVDMKWDIVFNVKDSISKIDDFKIIVDNVKLKDVYMVYSGYMEDQVQTPDHICTSCLLLLGEEHGMDYEMFRFDDSVVFVLTSKNMTIDGEPYEFMFANKYERFSCDNLPPNVDNFYIEDCLNNKLVDSGLNLEIKDIKDVKVMVGDNVSYQVTAKGYNISYEDNSYLFNINSSTGLIKFIPLKEMIGNHSVRIDVYDSVGYAEHDYFNIEVVERNVSKV